jgi:DNA invertase Pin-like site-specific DNA recombinase
VDDGVSGAEFVNRPGFMRLMNSLKSKPIFGILVSEESRLGRSRLKRRSR